jgi:hypothetical protein
MVHQQQQSADVVVEKEEKERVVDDEVEEKLTVVTEVKSERPVRGRPTRRDLTNEEMYESEDSVSKKSDDSDDFYPPRTSSESVSLRPASSLKKKFPTLKASPRVKEEGVKLREKRKMNVFPEKKNNTKKPKISATVNNVSGEEEVGRPVSRLERRGTKSELKVQQVQQQQQPQQTTSKCEDNNKPAATNKDESVEVCRVQYS